MRTRADVELTRWWRCTDYEIADGVVRPAPGAAVERFDPVQLADEEEIRAPYLQFIDAVEGLDLAFAGATAAPGSEAGAERLLRFVRRWGLPGLLQHQLEAARWPTGDFGEIGQGRNEVSPDGLRWLLKRGISLGSSERVSATAVVRTVDGDVETVPLARLGRFFHGVKPEEALLRADNARWLVYQEPLLDLFVVARRLRAVVELASPRFTEAGHSQPDQRGLAMLNALLRDSRRSLVARGAPRESWASRSLLGMFAAMLAGDLRGGRVRQCPCGGLFTSAQPRGTYCGPRCAERSSKRRRRDRERERRLAAARHRV